MGDLTYELPSDLDAIESFVESLLEHGRRVGFNPDRLRFNLRVCVTEAIANAMLYGNRQDPRKHVRIHARFAAHQITIRVTDEGRGFDPSRLPDPTTPANIRRTRGRGIFLIRKLMDHVQFNETGNSIEMRLLNGPGGPVAHSA
jgi:serine/threonine-protein kinase RsbW